MGVLGLVASGALNVVQRSIGDARFVFTSRPPTGTVLQVDIDAASIQALGVWPWSRAVYGTLLDKLRTLNATDIAFDVDFSSSSIPEGDAAFEAALRRANGTTILAALRQQPQGAGRSAAEENHPLDRFATQAWEASVNVRPDRDGHIRWLARQQAFAAGPMPTVAALLASVPGDAAEPFMIDFGIDATRLPHVSAVDLLQDRVPASMVAGRKVIVGATAVELRDFYQVPRFGFLPGATVQILAVESLIQGRALVPTALALTLGYSALVLLALGLGMSRLSLAGRLTLMAATAMAAEAAALWVQVRWPVSPVTAPLHSGLAALAISAIASELIERRRKLKESRRRAQRLAATLDRVVADNFAGIVVVDQDGVVRALSTVAAGLIGTQPDDAAGRPFQTVLPPELVALTTEVLGRLNSEAALLVVTRELHWEDGHGVPMILECVATVSTLPEDTTEGPTAERNGAVCLTFQDVTEKRSAEAKLAEMAHVDFLSGLANRFVLISALEAESTAEGVRGLLLFDVDRFKLVNDRFGHAAGDALIKSIAGRLSGLAQPGDIVARLGGDEFAILARRSDVSALLAVADRLVMELGGFHELGSVKGSVAVSVGLALDEGQTPKELLAAADAALFAAKTAGGDRYRLFDAAMRKQTEEAQRIEQDLREALLRQEFAVVYQRQVDAQTEEIVGVEALVRWTHPERGPVSPGLFIPIAERTGLIEPLGAWVLAEACREAAAWPVPIKVSVNLSAVQLGRPDLADRVKAILSETGLGAKRLDLELTESLLMEDDDVTKTTLLALRSAGVSIALDDFGTGYSSLSYLRSFPIDKVKIDQSFVRDLTSASSSAIVRAVVGLARELGLRINAEGVETPEQFQTLRSFGCDEIQGFLHGRPAPSAMIAADLEKQLRRRFSTAAE